MKIVVTVKDVPDVQSDRGIGPDGRLARDRGDEGINELDENAVQAAVDLARAAGAEVVAVCVGRKDAGGAVRRALQLGADRGVLVCDDRLAGLDAPATAAVLAAAVALDSPVDLVVTGMAATDGLTSLVPGVLARLLGVPALPLASTVAVAAGRVVVTRELEHATETASAPLPALISVTDEVNEPELPGFRAIMAARKKPVVTLGLDDLATGLARLGLDRPAARTVVLAAVPRPARTDRVLVTDGGGDAGPALAAWLTDRHLA